MDLAAFTSRSPGDLVTITGIDPVRGPWTHRAFVPHPLGTSAPDLSAATYRVVGDCRAALGALDSTARRLPNPRLFRRPALQAEAQSTSALEGTYAPLVEVLTADEDRPLNLDVREILNYVVMAETAFAHVEAGLPVTVDTLTGLQALLVAGTRAETAAAGSLRDHQVIVGPRREAAADALPAHAARFVPSPPGIDLRANLQTLLDWMRDSGVASAVDPVVAAALAHYQFEALHPFHDGNGRIGRLLVVLHLVTRGVLSEPTLTVSPWFEARRTEYYDRLHEVSTGGAWDEYVRFFAVGLEASAVRTHSRMLALVDVQTELRETVRLSRLRSDTARALVDHAVGHVSFTVRQVQAALGVSYGRANTVVDQLVGLGILRTSGTSPSPSRRFFAPRVMEVLTRAWD